MKYLLTIVFTLLLSLTIFGQESLSTDFTFKKTESDLPVYQVLPNDEKILSEADLGNAYQAIGIIAQPDAYKFGLMFVNVQEDYQFENQRSQLFNIYDGDNKFFSGVPTIIKKYQSKKYKVEYLTIALNREDFLKFVNAASIVINYGRIKANISTSNLSIFKFLQSKINVRSTSGSGGSTQTGTQTPTNNTGDVKVKGYYRRDGTYVRPHTRSKPRN